MQLLTNHFLAILVLYKQELDDSLTLQSLNQELEVLNANLDLVVYDNSPTKSFGEHSFAYKRFNVTYIHDESNSGLSRAYNTGAEIAHRSGKTWLILLDQDTKFSDGFLSHISRAIKKNPKIQIFTPILKLNDGRIFSPCISRHKRGYPVKRIAPGLKSLWIFSPVNSGVVINTHLFHKTGGYNERLKVDFCDFQFFEKVRLYDHNFFVVNSFAYQDFSAFEPSVQKQRIRFRIYLEDAGNCNKPRLSDKLGFFYAVSRHTLGLCWKLKEVSFLGMYIKMYLLKKK